MISGSLIGQTAGGSRHHITTSPVSVTIPHGASMSDVADRTLLYGCPLLSDLILHSISQSVTFVSGSHNHFRLKMSVTLSTVLVTFVWECHSYPRLGMSQSPSCGTVTVTLVWDSYSYPRLTQSQLPSSDIVTVTFVWHSHNYPRLT